MANLNLFRAWIARVFILISALILSACDSGSFLQENKPTTPEFVFDNIQITPINRLKGTDKLMTHIGFNQQFVATSRIDGQLTVITDKVTWHSTKVSIAEINQGRALGIQVGDTMIYASAGEVQSNRLQLEVGDANFFKLQIAPDAEAHPIGTLENKLIVGALQPFTATALFDDNTSLNVTSDATWTSAETSIANIEAANATAVSEGQTQVSASLKGIVSNDIELIVTAHTLLELHITPVETQVAQGSYIEFHADARYSDNSMQDVTGQVQWQNSNGSVALFSGNQLIALKAGETQVTATMLGMTSAEQALVTVTDSPMVSLQITPAKESIGIGGQLFYFAKATYADGSTQDVTRQADWQSSAPKVAEIIAGYAHAIAAGQTQMSATLNGITSNVALLEVNNAHLVDLQVSPASLNLAVNTTKDIVVYAVYSDDSIHDVSDWVTWSSSDIAVVAMVSHEVRGLAVGETAIKAHFNDISSNTATVEVTAAQVMALQVTPALHTMTTGDKVDYQVLATFDDDTSQDVSHQVAWFVEQAEVAGVKHGQAVGQAVGSTPIHVHLDGVSNQAMLNVADKYIESIQVTPAQATIAQGTEVHFDAIAHYNDNSQADITALVNWVTTDTQITTVLSGDVVGVSPGTVNISANYQNIDSNQAQLVVTDAILTDITVTPALSSVNVGLTQAYRALGTYSDGHTQDVTNVVNWQSSNNQVATITHEVQVSVVASDANLASNDSVLASTPLDDDEHTGQSAIATAISAGETLLQANLDDIYSNQAKLVVDDAVLVSLQVTPGSAAIAKGTEQYYQVIGVYSDDSSEDVTHLVSWLNSDPIIATIVEDHAVAINVGQTQLTAVKNQIKSNQVTLEVTSAVLTGLQITPAQATIPNGTEQLYQAIASYSDNTTQDVTGQVSWQSSDTNLVTVHGGDAHAVAVGSVMVQAFMGQVGSNQAELIVSSATLTSLQLTPAEATVAKGSHQDYHVIGTYSDQSQRELTSEVDWRLTPAGLAVMDKGDLQTLAVGQVSVVASFEGLSSPAAQLNITDAQMRGLQITPSDNQIAKGTDLVYAAQAVFSDGSVQDVTASVTWVSANPQVATISQGITHAETTGSTSIVAKLDGFSSNAANLQVTAATLDKIQVTPAISSIALGVEQDFTAIGTYSDNSTQALTDVVAWNSRDNNVATIVAGHLISVEKGQTKISANYQGVRSNDAEVTVTDKKVVKLQLTPSNLSVSKGHSQALEAKATYSDGSTRFKTDEVTWEVVAPATVSIVDGVLTGTVVGSTQVRAYWAQDDIYSNAIDVTVTAAVLESISLSPNSAIVKIGTEKLINASGYYSDGSQADLTNTVNWSSDNPAIATVVDGRVNGVTVGDVTVYAVIGQLYAQAQLRVEHDVLVDILITPDPINIPLGTEMLLMATGVYKGGETEQLTLADGISWSTNSVDLSISTDGVISANNANTNSITVSVSKGSVIGSVNANITNAIVESLQVRQTLPTTSQILTQGSHRELLAYATYSDGSTAHVTTLVNWQDDSNSTITSFIRRGEVYAEAIGVSRIFAEYQGVTSNSIEITVVTPQDLPCATPEIEVDGLTFMCMPSLTPSQNTFIGNGYPSPSGMVVSSGNLQAAIDYCTLVGARLPTLSELVNFRKKSAPRINKNYANVYTRYGWQNDIWYWTATPYDSNIYRVLNINTGAQYIRTIHTNNFAWACVKDN